MNNIDLSDSVILYRMCFLSKLITKSGLNSEDKDIALYWLTEMILSIKIPIMGSDNKKKSH